MNQVSDSETPKIPHIRLMGCRIDNLTMDETVNVVDGFIRASGCHQHVVVNVDKLVKASRSANLREIINKCALVNADGMPVVWAARWLGRPIKERVAGIDLFLKLVEKSASKKWRLFLLGASQEALNKAEARLVETYPGCNIVGTRNGYWTTEEEPSLVEYIRSRSPDIIFVAISSPKKEEFLARYQHVIGAPFAMGVGGSFDVIAGLTRRAPIWMQNAGLEWFFRFLQEPTRMFRRYFIEDLAFVNLFLKEILAEKRKNNTK